MNLFGYEIGRQKDHKFPVIPDTSISLDVRDQGTTIRPELKGVTIPDAKKPANIGLVRPNTLQYNTDRNRRGDFVEPEYDLAQVGRVEDTDSYVHQAFLKKIGLLFKEGYEFVGANPKTIQYIRLRLQQIARASGIPSDELIRSIGAGLIKKSNSFLVKVRKEKASGGRRRMKPGSNKELEPVAGYFIAPAETMEVDADAFGRVRRWKQRMPDGIFKFFNPDDVVHFYFNRKEGLLFGTPTLVPVIDDIRALRKIEENIELLVYQHLFPLFHYQIGTDQLPAGINETGESEIDVAKREIQYMPSEGGIVTSHRHQIQMIGAENRSLRADAYLEHFKKRVFSGLGISAVDMGEGECYSDDTQTLTENGWKFHWGIDHEKEKIATYNPFTKRIEFHLANYKYEAPYIGEMVKIQNQHVDMLVTPSHDMWVWCNKNADWKKMHAIDIANGKAGHQCMFLETAPFWDKEPSIPLPEGDVHVLAALAGYVSGLGTSRDGDIYIRQRPSIGLEPICDLLLTLGVTWSVIADGKDTYIKVDGDALEGWLARFLDVKGLVLAEEFPIAARKLFVRAFVQSSFKHRKVRSSGPRNEYITPFTNRLAVDAVQTLIMSAGYTAYVREKVSDQQGAYFTVRANLREQNRHCRMVNVKRDIQTVDYRGVIYCYNVPNHLFVTRRNNRVAIQGNTANRATSDNMSRNLVDSVKDIQRTLESQVNAFIISELLQESTFGADVLNEENIVKIQFKEIDLDHQIKKENHYADLFQKNTISLDEARHGIGRQPFAIPSAEEIESDPDIASKYPEWHRTHWKLIEEPKTLMQSIDEPYTAAAKAAAASQATSVTESQRTEAGDEQLAAKEKEEQARAKAQPKTPPKKSTDSLMLPRFRDLESDALQMVEKNAFDFQMFRQLAFVTADKMTSELKSRAMAAFASGYRSVNRNGLTQVSATMRSRNKVESRINFYVSRLIRDTVNSVKRQNIDVLSNGDRIQKVRAVFDSLRFRNRFIEDVEIRKAHNLGVLEGARDKGLTRWKIVAPVDACDTCKDASSEVQPITHIDLELVPPLHASARAEIEVLE